MKKCYNCGKEVSDEFQFCDDCGSPLGVTQEAAAEQVPWNNEKPKKKKTTVGGVIISIIVIIIARFVGGFVGSETAENFLNKRNIDDMDRYIESVNKYKPGTTTSEGYFSSHFGFKFIPDENWEVYNREDYKADAEDAYDNAVSAAVDTLRKDGAPEEVIDKYKETFYYDFEMMAGYIVDDGLAGEVVMSVSSAYMGDDTESVDVLEGIKEQFAFADSFEKLSSKYIGGEKYDCAKIVVTTDGMKLVNYALVRIEEDAMCMIICKGVEGYEDEMFDSFLSCTSEYDI